MTCAAILAASVSVNAQVVNEGFEDWGARGYISFISCEPASGTSNGLLKEKKDTLVRGVTYTLENCLVLPKCGVKKTTSTTVSGGTVTCTPSTDMGYVQVDKDGGVFSTSLFTKVNSVSVLLSWTGGYRNALLQSSADGVAWANVGDTLRGMGCDERGVEFNAIPVAKNNVKLRLVPTLDYKTQPNIVQTFRIHKFTVDGTLGTGTGISETSWSESGATVSLTDNNVSFASALNGTLSITSITGAVIAQQEISRDAQASFVMPSTGVYFVRFVSNNKVYTKKIMVK